jgi:hypothetical protein
MEANVDHVFRHRAVEEKGKKMYDPQQAPPGMHSAANNTFARHSARRSWILDVHRARIISHLASA